VFRSRVIGDLSYAPGRLKEAEEIAEKLLRRFVKGLITVRHTPRKSDFSPIGEIFGQIVASSLATRWGDVEEAEKSTEALTQLSKDPHYRLRNLLREAFYIAANIQVSDLLDFYQETKTSNLVLILPGWRRRIQPRTSTYRIVREK